MVPLPCIITFTTPWRALPNVIRLGVINEGQISRERALELVNVENQPRYQNINGIWIPSQHGLYECHKNN